jgi:hypothetical protein
MVLGDREKGEKVEKGDRGKKEVKRRGNHTSYPHNQSTTILVDVVYWAGVAYTLLEHLDAHHILCKNQ